MTVCRAKIENKISQSNQRTKHETFEIQFAKYDSPIKMEKKVIQY